ncbi:DUF6303 family protein [Streptomyces sp. MMS24-I29]|uniref:DUF6303 family protein n=1 Tax=Streptomyces sp. MMS24-I29 TaxID=3351480 RepID=UPI003C7C8B4D
MNRLPAQMSNSGGRWHLYVPLSTPGAWPAHDWPRFASTPTLAEREQVLNALGYETVPCSGWRWIEDSDIPDDPASPVFLIAAAMVRPIPTGGAT